MVISAWLLSIAVLAAGLLGALLAWLASRGGLLRAREQAAQSLTWKQELGVADERLRGSTAETAKLRQSLGGFEALVEALGEKSSGFETEIRQFKEEREALLRQRQATDRELAEVRAHLENERKQGTEKLGLLNEARGQLAKDFEIVANKILEEKSARFTTQNKENLDRLLTPLKDQLTDFRQKVEQVHKEGSDGRLELKYQIGELKLLNDRLSQDATNLVSALKGSSKVQGDWGEFILEGLLEASGLRKDHDYRTQATMKHDDGRGARLDVIVNLPGGRHLVVDSKLSLIDYTEFCGSAEGLTRDAALARHLASVRTHLKGLSERNYQSLYGLRSLDFVIMFIPIEPAFMLAIAHDSKLWNDAWQKNVLLVSPSTLLFVIRTVAHLWKQEQQTQNAKQIARRGADLYDKFVGFVDDLKVVGTRLNQARESYDTAYGKLSSGRGNLVKQAEQLRDLGVKPKKALSNDVIASAGVQQEDLFELGEGEESTQETA